LVEVQRAVKGDGTGKNAKVVLYQWKGDYKRDGNVRGVCLEKGRRYKVAAMEWCQVNDKGFWFSWKQWGEWG